MKEVLLLGDSITEWNPLVHQKILNLGVAGDTTEDIWLRKKEVEEARCQKVIFKAGVNDVLKNFSLEKSQFFYNEIAELLNSKFEEVVVFSVLPVEGHKKINIKVRKLNKLIEEISQKNNFKFINIHNIFCDDYFNLKSEYTVDGIHLSEKGYDILNSEILKII